MVDLLPLREVSADGGTVLFGGLVSSVRGLVLLVLELNVFEGLA